MSESIKSDQNKVVQLNPERNAAPHVALTRLPAPMHSLRDKARQQLQVMLRELFDRADDALFELADKATNNHEQNLYFDSMREVRIRRRAIEAAFFRSIDIGFAQLLDPYAYRDQTRTEEKEISLDELSLVKNDELEELVATEGMINKANDQFAESIQHLTMRIDHLVPVKVYQKNNPLGVDVICNAFTDATKSARIDVKAKLVLFKLFDNLVMVKLGGLFQALNQQLIEANILPSLKQGTRIKKTTAAPASPYGAGASSQNAAGQGSSAGSAGYDEQTNEVLHTLRDLLGSRNAPVRPSGEELASQELINILSQAQHRSMSGSVGHSHAAPVNVREMLKDLLKAQEQKPQNINQVDDDVINLVSMMFEFILDDRNLAAPMKVLLGRLQIPMIKVAIADKSFFSKGGHPARRLLNELATAALGWQEGTEENQRKDNLFSKIEEVVQTVLSDFEADMSIFNVLLNDFRAYLDKEKRRAQILEQRTIDAEDGKARSERARADVDTALNAVIGRQNLPAAALKLLRDAWANVMFITCLKHGIESEEWQGRINTAQQLVWSLCAPMDKENRQRLLKLVPVLLQQLRQGLESISYNPFDATHLFKQLEGLHLARLRGDAAPVAVPTPKAPQAVPGADTSAKPAVTSVNKGAAANQLVEPAATTPAPVAVEDARAEQVTGGVEVASGAGSRTRAPQVEATMVNVAGAKATEVDPASATGSGPVGAAIDGAVGNDSGRKERVAEGEASEPQPRDSSVVDASLPAADAPRGEAAKAEVASPTVAESVNAAQPFVVMSQDTEEQLPEDDQHLSLVANVTQGSWFEMAGDGGQKFRCRLAAIIRPTGKYIFVNRSGMKVAEETRNSLALAMKSGRLRVLDDGMLFDRALEAVIGNLRQGRPTN